MVYLPKELTHNLKLSLKLGDPVALYRVANFLLWRVVVLGLIMFSSTYGFSPRVPVCVCVCVCAMCVCACVHVCALCVCVCYVCMCVCVRMCMC